MFLLDDIWSVHKTRFETNDRLDTCVSTTNVMRFAVVPKII